MDKSSKVINLGYTLDSVSISKITNEYVCESKSENKKVDADRNVLDFIFNCLNKN